MSDSTFIKRQITQIRQGGRPMVAHKFNRAFRALLRISRRLPLYALAISAVIVIRLIRPWLLVRVGGLGSSRIGHFAGNTELYLCERDAGINVPKERHVDLFYMDRLICNQQLATMWKRLLHVWPSWILGRISRVNRLIPGGTIHEIGHNTQNDRDVHNLLDRFPAYLSFTPEEDKKGYFALQDIGISDATPFVCLHSRDSAYLDATYLHMDWHYHDYLDNNIENYILAAEELTSKGYPVLRMGAVVEKRLKTISPGIIDYAANYRSDFMDIYLEAKCFFYLGSSSGLNAVPMVFRRPRAIANFAALEYVSSWSSNDLFIPKKLWLVKENRFMTFREILESGVGRFLKTEQYNRKGLELIENTPEEIKDLAIEMDERLKGKWQTTKEDERLQDIFWSLFKSSELHGTLKARIGADFLRQNIDLLK